MKNIVTIFIGCLLFSSCMTLTHTVGNGGKFEHVKKKRAVYALFGLVAINKFDSKTLANGAVNYTVKTKFTIVDLLISIPASIVTFHTQTVYVSE